MSTVARAPDARLWLWVKGDDNVTQPQVQCWVLQYHRTLQIALAGMHMDA